MPLGCIFTKHLTEDLPILHHMALSLREAQVILVEKEISMVKKTHQRSRLRNSCNTTGVQSCLFGELISSQRE